MNETCKRRKKIDTRKKGDAPKDVVNENDPEGDWEWEYYESGEEEEEEEEEVDEVEQEKPDPILAKKRQEEEARMPWILQGLSQLIPKIPVSRMKNNLCDDDDDISEEDNERLFRGASSGKRCSIYSQRSDATDTDRGKGYKEWLEESAQLHEGAHLNLQAEIEGVDEYEDKALQAAMELELVDKEVNPDEGEGNEKESSPLKSTKASKLVEKIKSLKKISKTNIHIHI